jgi:two-component system, NarL family, nitrate/nitrite response regulator NarL
LKTDPIKIFLVDDHQIVLDGLEAMLCFNSDFEIVGMATNGNILLEYLISNEVDIVLTDTNMPIIDGVELIKKAKKLNPLLKFLALSMNTEGESIRDMVAAGANGYIFKNGSKSQLTEAIHVVHQGKKFFSAEANENLLIAQKKQAEAPEEILTIREIEIIKMLAKGLKTKEIAEQLFISEKTVKTHRQNISYKTNTNNSVSLLLEAQKRGIIK